MLQCPDRVDRHGPDLREPSDAGLFHWWSVLAPRAHSAAGVRTPRSTYALWAAIWLCSAFALVGIGYAIGIELESPLLGFLGADFVFLIAMSLYTSGPARGRR